MSVAHPGKCPNCGDNAPLVGLNNRCFLCGAIGVPTVITGKFVAANLRAHAKSSKLPASLRDAMARVADIYERSDN